MPFETKLPRKINIFYCYAHEDRKARVTLAKHLSNLRWQGYIDEWYDGEINPGAAWEEEIATHLENADIILLLITSNFMDSYYRHEVELKRAIERQKEETAQVIPIIISHVDWENAPFSKLQPLPTDGKPVSEWQPRDKAYHDISEGIKRVVNAFLGIPEKSEPKQPAVRRRAQANHRSFAAVGYQTATPRYQKRLPPMRYGPSLGMRLQNFFINFSFREFKRRTHRGYLVVLLFIFGVCDLLVLPYLTWTLLPALGIVAFVFVLRLV